MKTTTVLIVGVGGLAALYLLSSSKQSGGVLGSLGSLGNLGGSVKESVDNLADVGKAATDIAASFAGAAENIAQTGENLTSIPMNISSTGANVVQHASQNFNAALDAVNRPSEGGGLWHAANTGDALKNLFSFKW